MQASPNVWGAVLGVALMASAAWGQDQLPDDGLGELDLFEMDTELKKETSIASVREQGVRETPGVVSIVTRDEIVESGAQELGDVLQLVPGFTLALDTQGTVGLGFRGNWAHEGKVLLMIDGQEVNEHLYSTLQFGGHYPVQNIERVEIIRGPGSSTYGGYAGLAVINVITRSGKALNGGRVALDYGLFGPSLASFSQRTLNLEYGQKIAQVEGLSASISAYVGQAHRSGGTYSDYYGNSYPMIGNARTDPRFVNLGVDYKDLHFRFLYDEHRVWSRDAYDEALEQPVPTTFRSLVGDLRLQLRPTDTITVTPRLSWSRQAPWNDGRPGSPLYFDKTDDRYRAQVTANFLLSQTFDLLVGAEGYLDHAKTHGVLDESSNTVFTNGSREVMYGNGAAFAQLVVTHPIVNVIVGARLEHHSAVGTSFVPRLALTRLWSDFHVKALYTRAFRAPGIQNIQLGLDVKPEATQSIELEAGYQWTEEVSISANAFDISIFDPIIYSYDEETDTEGYDNFDRTGTRGLEAELRFARRGMFVNASYSLAVANDNRVTLYRVAGNDNQMLAMPIHKVALNAGFNVWGPLQLNPSGYFVSERLGFLSGAIGAPRLGTAPPAVVLNLFATYRDLGLKGLDVSAGVRDVLNAAPPFIQPYNGGHAPLPGPGREVLLRVAYDFSLE